MPTRLSRETAEAGWAEAPRASKRPYPGRRARGDSRKSACHHHQVTSNRPTSRTDYPRWGEASRNGWPALQVGGLKEGRNRVDLIDKLNALAATISRVRDSISTEEATKNALVLPFINALGYNVFDPTEVTPELCADVGTKKGEKVDYAILRDGVPIMLIECKPIGGDLKIEHASQLYRYFSVTEARFAVLTDGVTYRFYTDLEQPNKMDARPFLDFCLLDIRESQVEELKKFAKSAFEVDTILATANELKYTREIKRVLAEELADPSEGLVRHLVSRVYEGRMTPALREQFTNMVRRGFQQFVSDRVSERLKTALDGDVDPSVVSAPAPSRSAPIEPADTAEQPAGRLVDTTDDEREAYLLVKAILRGTVDAARVAMRDAQSYCAILLDDNNRRPLCRLHFNNLERKQISLFDAAKQERKEPIGDLDDILNYADELRATAASYGQPGRAAETESAAAHLRDVS